VPGVAAIGGMLIPAAGYIVVNWSSPATLRGWAIPAATDIAFALGVLSLFGSRVPVSLKLFLTALAILDDLGAIVIIAIFYTADLSPLMLGLAALVLGALVALNLAGVRRLSPFVVLGVLLWFLVLKSGVHATVARVLLALTIPLRRDSRKSNDSSASPLHRLEHTLHPWSAFAVLPIFGFANAGVALAGTSWQSLSEPVTLGVALGLFFGKQVGVFGSVWLTVKLGWGRRPAQATWLQVWRRDVVRRGLHHEPVHRSACLCPNARTGNGNENWGPAWIYFIDLGRGCDAGPWRTKKRPSSGPCGAASKSSSGCPTVTFVRPNPHQWDPIFTWPHKRDRRPGESPYRSALSVTGHVNKRTAA
jgi:hypothetical protein